jgi:hypothetical protein
MTITSPEILLLKAKAVHEAGDLGVPFNVKTEGQKSGDTCPLILHFNVY